MFERNLVATLGWILKSAGGQLYSVDNCESRRCTGIMGWEFEVNDVGKSHWWKSDLAQTAAVAALVIAALLLGSMAMVFLSHRDNDNHGGTGGDLSCPPSPGRCTATFHRHVDGAEVVFHGNHVRLMAVEGDVATIDLHAGVWISTARLRPGESGKVGPDDDDPTATLKVLTISSDDVIAEISAPNVLPLIRWTIVGFIAVAVLCGLGWLVLAFR